MKYILIYKKKLNVILNKTFGNSSIQVLQMFKGSERARDLMEKNQQHRINKDYSLAKNYKTNTQVSSFPANPN